jgi:hypothetical protein
MFSPLKTFDTALLKVKGALVRHRPICTHLKFPDRRSEQSEKSKERARERERPTRTILSKSF